MSNGTPDPTGNPFPDPNKPIQTVDENAKPLAAPIEDADTLEAEGDSEKPLT